MTSPYIAFKVSAEHAMSGAQIWLTSDVVALERIQSTAKVYGPSSLKHNIQLRSWICVTSRLTWMITSTDLTS